MGNVIMLWVASRSDRPEYALDEGNLLAVCATGPNPREDAESYARDETMATDRQTYVYCVELVQVMGYKICKKVDAFVPTK